mmetsp:Transcript_29794/g.40928  ORF Transcript_29794/g.40928 Transcript_29794/m.40928 type:complete len:217 (-) Transcript_29794:2121-2771(-)
MSSADWASVAGWSSASYAVGVQAGVSLLGCTVTFLFPRSNDVAMMALRLYNTLLAFVAFVSFIGAARYPLETVDLVLAKCEWFVSVLLLSDCCLKRSLNEAVEEVWVLVLAGTFQSAGSAASIGTPPCCIISFLSLSATAPVTTKLLTKYDLISGVILMPCLTNTFTRVPNATVPLIVLLFFLNILLHCNDFILVAFRNSATAPEEILRTAGVPVT